MARGSDPGRDFDNQYNDSRRKGQEKAARGEGPWADDKKLRDISSSGGGDAVGGGCLIMMISLIVLAVVALTGCSAESDLDRCDRAFKDYLVAKLATETAQEAQALDAMKTPAACERLDDDDRAVILNRNSDLMVRVALHESELDSEFPG